MNVRRYDAIRFAVSPIPFDRADVRAGEDVAFVFVNGRDLLDVVDDFERPLAISAGLSGDRSYVPARAADVLPPSGHWLGTPKPALSMAGWAVIFTCECGAWECGGLLARIDAGENVVVWSDFQTPFTLEWMAEWPDRPVEGSIPREGLGPLVFDRDQYESALRAPDRIVWPFAAPGPERQSGT